MYHSPDFTTANECKQQNRFRLKPIVPPVLFPDNSVLQQKITSCKQHVTGGSELPNAI